MVSFSGARLFEIGVQRRRIPPRFQSGIGAVTAPIRTRYSPLSLVVFCGRLLSRDDLLEPDFTGPIFKKILSEAFSEWPTIRSERLHIQKCRSRPSRVRVPRQHARRSVNATALLAIMEYTFSRNVLKHHLTAIRRPSTGWHFQLNPREQRLRSLNRPRVECIDHLLAGFRQERAQVDSNPVDSVDPAGSVVPTGSRTIHVNGIALDGRFQPGRQRRP